MLSLSSATKWILSVGNYIVIRIYFCAHSHTHHNIYDVHTFSDEAISNSKVVAMELWNQVISFKRKLQIQSDFQHGCYLRMCMLCMRVSAHLAAFSFSSKPPQTQKKQSLIREKHYRTKVFASIYSINNSTYETKALLHSEYMSWECVHVSMPTNEILECGWSVQSICECSCFIVFIQNRFSFTPYSKTFSF